MIHPDVAGFRRFILMSIAAGLFFLSGGAALVYQVIWQRVLGVFSGIHFYSITIIVAAFMLGLGIGSLAGGSLADRLSRKHSIIGFALCEVGIAAFGMFSIWFFYDVAYLKLGFLVRYELILPLIHFALVAFPTFLMGASLPLLSRGLIQDRDGAATGVSILYGANTIGAAVGAFTCVWFLIGEFGFEGAVQIAATLNLLAGLGALIVAVGIRDVRDERLSIQSIERPEFSGLQPRTFGLWSWAAVYALSGFVALSFELLWLRILGVAIKTSPYAFGHLLGFFLLFLALGSLLGSKTCRNSMNPGKVFLWGQWVIGTSAAAALVLLMHYPADTWPMSELQRFWQTDESMRIWTILAALGGVDPDSHEILRVSMKIWVMLPILLFGLPTFLMGWTYAYIQRAVQTDMAAVGWRVGLIQAANILGAMLGSIVTGTVFLGVLGTPLTFMVLVTCAALFGLLASFRSRSRLKPGGAVLVIGSTAMLLVQIPEDSAFWARLHGSAPDQIVVSEDASAVVALQRQGPTQSVLRVNGTGMSLLPYGGVWTDIGLYPALLHPNPERVLLIGFGLGNTAWAAAGVPGVRHVDVYEIAKPEMDVLLAAQDRWGSDRAVETLLASPKLDMNYTDGRLAMRIENEKYDVIEADPLEVGMAYSGNLYSKEFYELVRRSLKPRGILFAWTPSIRTRNTVLSVFPYAKIVGWFVVASNEPFEIDRNKILDKFEDEALQAYLRNSGALLARKTDEQFRSFVDQKIVEVTPAMREKIAKEDINTDLYPRDEYSKIEPAVPR